MAQEPNVLNGFITRTQYLEAGSQNRIKNPEF